MLLRRHNLGGYPTAFRALTGLTVAASDALLPGRPEAFHADRRPRPDRPGRRRAFGGGDAFDLDPADQLPLTVVWPRQYPTREVLGFLFGASDSSALRAGARCLPLLEKAGREHGLARLRRYQALSQVDRRRRRAQTARVRAAAGPVNRRMGHHEAA